MSVVTEKIFWKCNTYIHDAKKKSDLHSFSDFFLMKICIKNLVLKSSRISNPQLYHLQNKKDNEKIQTKKSN